MRRRRVGKDRAEEVLLKWREGEMEEIREGRREVEEVKGILAGEIGERRRKR